MIANVETTSKFASNTALNKTGEPENVIPFADINALLQFLKQIVIWMPPSDQDETQLTQSLARRLLSPTRPTPPFSMKTVELKLVLSKSFFNNI